MTDMPCDERPYFRCPACGVVGEPDSADYHLTPDGLRVDWATPVIVSCGSCRGTTTISLSDVVGRDAEQVCSRCEHRTACPVDADRVICRGCGLNSPGPAALGARAGYLRDVERSANEWALAEVRVAKTDAFDRGALPGWASRPRA